MAKSSSKSNQKTSRYLILRIVTVQLVFLIGTHYSYAQSALLSPRTFQGQSLDQQWIYVKHRQSGDQVAPDAKPLSSDQNHPLNKILKLKIPAGKNPIDYCNELRKSGKFSYVDPIVQYVPLASPSDALLSNQYYLNNIRAFEAWDITTGDDDITIGIIDTGIDTDHEDIVTNLWLNEADPIDGIDNDSNGYVDDYFGYDFADEDSDPNIQRGNHGMIVGGIAGASTNNGKGIAGVGYNTKIAALKGFKSSNGISGGLYEAIIYAADNGIEVLNLSWGRMGSPLQSEQDIINYAVLEKDVIVIAAAGNEGGKTTEEEKWYPASYDHVLSVGATNANDEKSSGSTFNHSVDLVAPGVAMFSTFSDNGYSDGGPGTSYAAPQVAAAAALVKDQFPDLTAAQIMERVRVTSDDIYDIGSNAFYEGKLGKGRLNVYRAVSESNVKSLTIVGYENTSSQGDHIFFGDTVEIEAQLVNHLSVSNNPLVTISSPSEDFIIFDNPKDPGFLGSMDTTNLSFKIIIDEDVAPESPLDVRVDYNEGSYNDFQYLELATSPDYVDFGNEVITMTNSGNGNLALHTYGANPLGSGLQYRLDTLLSYAGMMLATSLTSVSDNIISSYSDLTREQDFEVQKNYKLYHHQAADYFGYSEFTDPNHSVTIEQSNITWQSEDFIITRYRLINTSPDTIRNLSVGFYADWDLNEKTSNYATYDAANNYMLTRTSDSVRYAGVQILGGDSLAYSALDLEALNGNSQDIDTLFTDELKYDYLVNQEILSAGSQGNGNDVATINGVTITELGAFRDAYINVIYAIADSKQNLTVEFQNAQDRLTDFIQKPRVLETFFTCNGASFSIDPTAGNDYELYEDPLGENLISTGAILEITNISSDTLFYVKNVDSEFSSDIFEIRINLFEDIADFDLSQDTLYLDHPTTNVIQFTDQSLDAISWDWDFGQGTSSTLQNPSLSFSEPGNYTISLSVESSQGCIDAKTKNLVVTARPSPPNLSTIISCPGDDVLISDPSADNIQVYTFEDQVNPSLSGSSPVIPNVLRDTTIFVSGVYNSFQSNKTELFIDVLEVPGQLYFSPDTSSIDNRILLQASDLDENVSVEWVIDGESISTSTAISVDATVGTLGVELILTSDNGCAKVLRETFLISTSPIAFQTDLISCNQDSVIIRPSNGTFFGFYEDQELTQLIKKGTQLKTNLFDKVYVAGLDDGLPGQPIEVNVRWEVPEVKIAFTAESIGANQQIKLSAESVSDVVEYQWSMNGSYFESIANPVIFVDNGQNEITLQVTTSSGCVAQDTLLLDFTPPLSSVDKSYVHIYPNPTSGLIQVRNAKAKKVEVYQMDGKLIASFEPKEFFNELNISHLTRGTYLVKVHTPTAVIVNQVLLR